jgi:hypothetical protein
VICFCNGCMEIPIAQVLTNQRASSGSCQTLPIACPLEDICVLIFKLQWAHILFISTKGWVLKCLLLESARIAMAPGFIHGWDS